MVLQMSLLKVGLNAQGLYADFNGLHRQIFSDNFFN